jgi:acetylornithine deacetylase/succinyl-diaminopimelate desuccinylase-like protein
VISVAEDARMRRAFSFIAGDESAIEADQIRLSLIPAPPFGETARCGAFADDLRAAGLQPALDAEGNVLAAYDRTGRNPVVLDAHLDTVFPSSLRLELRRKGRQLHLPGISDNGSGIAAILAFIRAARHADLRFRRPVIFLGSVGEEGEGNLRGVRHLFRSAPWREENNGSCDFIAIDGSGMHRITHQALGSRRVRVRMTGPGGHSWADFGRPNPVHIMASAIHAFVSNHSVGRHGASFNVGLIRGGIAVNAIPSEACAEVDLRATTAAYLNDLDQHLQKSVNTAVLHSGVECRMEVMGERPSGETPVSSHLVQAAVESTRYFGIDAHLDIGSTNANVPMSLGVPAIAVGAGGTSGNIHTPQEWFDSSQRHIGLQRLLLLVAILAGLE